MLRKQDLEMYECLQTIFVQQCNGDDIDNYVIDIIKNVSQCHSHQLKRLIHQFWPTINPFYPNGQLKPYMILICNSIQQDLESANEFIVASALRCVSNLQAGEIVKHVVQAVEQTLSHEKAEVRYYSVICCTIWSDLINKDKVISRISQEDNVEVMKKLIEFVKENYNINDYFQIFMNKMDNIKKPKLLPELVQYYYDLNQQNQQVLVQELQDINSWQPQDLYELACKIDMGEIQELNNIQISAYLLSCNNANNQIIPIIFQKLRNISFKNLQESTQIVSSVLSLLQQNEQNSEVTNAIFESRILQKLTQIDNKQNNKVVNMLANSRIIEESPANVLLKLIQTIEEIILQGGINNQLQILQSLIQCLNKSENNQYWQEITKIILNLVKNLQQDEKIEILLNILSLKLNMFMRKIAYDFIIQQLTQIQLPEDICNFLLCQLQQDLLQLEQSQFSQQNYIVLQSYSNAVRMISYQTNNDSQQVKSVLIQVAKAYLQIKQNLTIQQQQDIERIIKSLYVYVKENKKTLKYHVVKIQDQQQQQQQQNIQKESFIPQFSLFQQMQNKQHQVQQQQQQTHKKTHNLNQFDSLNNTIENDPILLQDVVQLSADSDQVFAECLIKRNDSFLQLIINVTNRTEKLVESLRCNLLSESCLCSSQNQTCAILPHQSEKLQFSVQIVEFCELLIFGQLEVKFKNSKQINMRLIPIRIPIQTFLQENQISKSEFQKQWKNNKNYEVQSTFTPNIEQIKKLKLSLISEIKMSNEQLYMFSTKNVNGDVAYIYINTSGRIKIKSLNKQFAEAIKNLIQNQ